VFALYQGLSHRARWAIIDGITSDNKNEQEIEFVDKKRSHRRKKEVSAICVVLELANPVEKVSEMENDGKDVIPSFCVKSWSWIESSNAKRRWSRLWKNEESEKRKAFLLEKRFNIVP